MRKGIDTTHDSSRSSRKSCWPFLTATVVLVLAFLLVPLLQDACNSSSPDLPAGTERLSGNDKPIRLAQSADLMRWLRANAGKIDRRCGLGCAPYEVARNWGAYKACLQRCVPGGESKPKKRKAKRKKPKPRKKTAAEAKDKQKDKDKEWCKKQDDDKVTCDPKRAEELGCPPGLRGMAECVGDTLYCYDSVLRPGRQPDVMRESLFSDKCTARGRFADAEEEDRAKPDDKMAQDKKPRDRTRRDRKAQDQKPRDTTRRAERQPTGSKPIDAQTVKDILKEVLGGGKDKGQQTASGGPPGGPGGGGMPPSGGSGPPGGPGGGGMPPSGGSGPGGSGSPGSPRGGGQPQPGSRGPGGAGTPAPAESTGDDTQSSGPATTSAAPPAEDTGRDDDSTSPDESTRRATPASPAGTSGRTPPATGTGPADDSEDAPTSLGSGPTPEELLDNAPGHKPIYTASQRDTTAPSEESCPAAGKEPGSPASEGDAGRPDTEGDVPGWVDQPSTVGTGSNLLDTLIREVAPPVYGSSPDVEEVSTELKTTEDLDLMVEKPDYWVWRSMSELGTEHSRDPRSMSIKDILKEYGKAEKRHERYSQNVEYDEENLDRLENRSKEAAKQNDWKRYNDEVSRTRHLNWRKRNNEAYREAYKNRLDSLRGELKTYREGERGSAPRPTARDILEGVRDDKRGVGPGIFK